MPLFQYRVIDSDGKEVSGALDATNAEAAKNTLLSLHPTILSVTEAVRLRKPDTETQTSSLMQTFAFEGSDVQGKIHRGTIDASSKRAAFQMMKKDRGLQLNMLSPLGFTPNFHDEDLLRWQKETQNSITSRENPVSNLTAENIKKKSPLYHPLLDTLTLYSGWLLSWYALFIALGYYANERQLPFSIPFVEGFYLSSMTWNTVLALLFFIGTSYVWRSIDTQPLLKFLLGVGSPATFFLLQRSLL